MQGVGVECQQGEEVVVGLQHRLAGAVLIDIADLEILVVTAEALAITLRADLLEVLHHGPLL